MKTNKDYAKLLGIMQERGEMHNTLPVEIGTMQSANTCSIGDLPLDGDDLLINSTLKGKLKKGDEVAMMQVADQDKYVILCKVVDA